MKIVRWLATGWGQIKTIFFTHSWNYFKQGYQVGQLKRYTFYYLRYAFDALRHFGNTIRDELGQGSFDHPAIKRLAQYTKGLHQLLPQDTRFSYSVLIAMTPTTLFLFKQTLQSALLQTAPLIEILVGYPPQLSADLQTFLQEQASKYPQLRLIPVVSEKESDRLNELADKASYDWLLCLGAKDWIRPDYLFRCEQLLRLLPSTFQCLYTHEDLVHETGIHLLSPKNFHERLVLFPYSFQNFMGRSVLIQRQAWLKVGGLQLNPKQDGFWELGWRLYLEGTPFHLLPFPLYKRCQEESSPLEEEQLLANLTKHTQALNLNWIWTKGLVAQTYRALPPLPKLSTVQVIIPYKNQKEMTLKAVKTALAQTDVKVYVTAIDNHSEDLSIADEIEKLGGEVLKIQEPFNYSRLNNLAVRQTQTAQSCEYVLFLNNDVELELNALAEMCRWIDQPGIGWVGCQLFYPNGLLQHGGVDLMLNRPYDQMLWNHSERLRPDAKRTVTQVLRIANAVTAACALIRRQTFLDVGGFDETWYPIAYSDTNLAVKLQSQGLASFYTPYAQGVHRESVSRVHENIEDVESSTWLHEHYILQHQLKFSNYLSLQSNASSTKVLVMDLMN
jgi:O-antigen biosynthesis protein